MGSNSKCFNDVRESFLNTQLTEELALLTPRDIRVTVESWATVDTNKERVEEMIFDWLKPYRDVKTRLIKIDGIYQVQELNFTDRDYTPQEKHKLLMTTLQHTDRDIDRMVKKAGAYTDRVAKYEKDMRLFVDKIRNLSSGNKTRLLNTLEEINYNYIWEYSDKSVPSKEEEINIIAEEIRERTEHRKTVPVMKLAREEYSNIFGEGRCLDSYYPYLNSFLREILDYEYFVSMEIKPNIDRLNHLKRPSSTNILKETIIDKEWYDRWLYFSQVGTKNRHQYAATTNSDKWAISFEDFAHLYRALHRKTNRFIISPFPKK